MVSWEPGFYTHPNEVSLNFLLPPTFPIIQLLCFLLLPIILSSVGLDRFVTQTSWVPFSIQEEGAQIYLSWPWWGFSNSCSGCGPEVWAPCCCSGFIHGLSSECQRKSAVLSTDHYFNTLCKSKIIIYRLLKWCNNSICILFSMDIKTHTRVLWSYW